MSDDSVSVWKKSSLYCSCRPVKLLELRLLLGDEFTLPPPPPHPSHPFHLAEQVSQPAHSSADLLAQSKRSANSLDARLGSYLLCRERRQRLQRQLVVISLSWLMQFIHICPLISPHHSFLNSKQPINLTKSLWEYRINVRG